MIKYEIEILFYLKCLKVILIDLSKDLVFVIKSLPLVSNYFKPILLHTSELFAFIKAQIWLVQSPRNVIFAAMLWNFLLNLHRGESRTPA